jgi:hypothetical protein
MIITHSVMSIRDIGRGDRVGGTEGETPKSRAEGGHSRGRAGRPREGGPVE